MIIKKLIRNQPNIVQLGQEIKEWVAWLTDQHLVAGVAEQAEEETVGLTGAGGENDLLRIDRGSVIAIVKADCFPRPAKTSWIRFVSQGERVVERGQKRLGVVGKATLGWI